MSYVDAWTLGHAAWGLLFGIRRMTLGWVLAAALGWEWLENTVLPPNWGERGNPINSVFDVVTAAVACGCVVAARAAARAEKGKRLAAAWRDVDEWDG